MQSANFNGSCKKDNFQLKYFVCVSYFCLGLCPSFCSETDCGHTLVRK